MNCLICGFFNEEPSEECGRCGAELPAPACAECGCDVPWGVSKCDDCRADAEMGEKAACPSCSNLNSVSAEYCTACGSPMAIVTRVVRLGRAREREPLDTWRVYGIETTLVGREREIEALFQAYHDTLEADALQLFKLTGDIGLGKSRILSEFHRRIDGEMTATMVLHGASRDDAGAPYSMFARMLKARFYMPHEEHPEHARARLLAAIESIVREKDEAERLAHLVGELINVHWDDSPHVPSVTDSEGAGELDRRSFEAVRDVLRADSARNPLVILLEDLQYATNQSLDLIKFLTEELADCPILFVLSWNPTELVSRHVLGELEFDASVTLDPLSDDEVESFLSDTLRKADEIPRALIDSVIASAHGNPLSVEEMLRILISQGVVDTREAKWKVDEAKMANVELPKTVRGTVLARIRSLSPEELEVLEMAASIGSPFWVGAVRSLYRMRAEDEAAAQLDWTNEEVDNRAENLLESLERKDIVRRREDGPEGSRAEMYFKHRIERQTLVDEIDVEKSRKYHRLIAQWMMSTFDDLDPWAESIARHFDEARVLDRAARFYLRAAGMARRRYSNEKAVELYTKGLSYTGSADLGLKIEAFEHLGDVYEFQGEFDQSLAYYREMLRCAWLLDDPSSGGRAYNRLGRAYRSLGHYDRALEEFEQALTLFRSSEDVSGIASTLDEVGQIHWVRGSYAEARRCYTAALQLRREVGDERMIAVTVSHLGILKMHSGELREAMVCFRESLEIRKRIGDRQGVVDSFNSLGAMCMERGDLDQALTLFEEALSVSRDIGYRTAEAVLLNNIGELHLVRNRVVDAKNFLEDAFQVTEECGEKRVLFDVLRNLAKLAVRESDRELALERINEALRIANQLDSQVLIAVGMQSLADIHAHYVFDDELRETAVRLAEECFQDALGLLRQIGNESELARCQSAYGQFLIEQGDLDRGREQMESAGDIFKRLQMHKLHGATQRVLAATNS